MFNPLSPVTSVLVTKGDQPIVAVGTTIDQILPGQIGFFDEYGVAVDATTVLDISKLMLAVGTNKGTLTGAQADGYITSAFRHIDLTDRYIANAKCYSPSQDEKWIVSGFDICCDKTYTLRVNVQSGMLYNFRGFLGLERSHTVKARCCKTSCATCDPVEVTPDCKQLVIDLYHNINTAANVYYKAEYVDITNPAAPVVLTEAAVLALTDCDNLGLQLETIPEKMAEYCCIDLNDYYRKAVKLELKFTDELECVAKAERIQEVALEQNSGEQVWQVFEEYALIQQAAPTSWYQFSHLTPLPISHPKGIVDKSEKYTVVNIQHDSTFHNSHHSFVNRFNTIIAIPCTDSATTAAVAALLDAAIAKRGQEKLATVLGTCGCSTAPIEVSDIDDTKVDGIGDN